MLLGDLKWPYDVTGQFSLFFWKTNEISNERKFYTLNSSTFRPGKGVGWEGEKNPLDMSPTTNIFSWIFV